MNARKFDLKAKDESDMMCKQKVISLFSNHPLFKAVLAEDYYIFDEAVEFKVDVILVDRVTGKHVSNVEVERKLLWIDEFPFNDIQFLPRKKEKWDNPVYTFGKPTHWMLFNKDCSRNLMVNYDDINNLTQTRKVNTIRGEEDLYVIPLDAATFDYEKTY